MSCVNIYEGVWCELSCLVPRQASGRLSLHLLPLSNCCLSERDPASLSYLVKMGYGSQVLHLDTLNEVNSSVHGKVEVCIKTSNVHHHLSTPSSLKVTEGVALTDETLLETIFQPSVGDLKPWMYR